MNYKLFHSALLMSLGLVLLFSACGTAPTTLIATSTSVSTKISEPTITASLTAIPSRTPSPTVTPDFIATQQYEDFLALVQKYHHAGQISTTAGEYVQLDDYEHAVANKLSYDWTETGITAKNFILRADFEWTNAVNTTNISGCGFVYRTQPNGDHYLIILDASSGVKLASSTDRGTYSMGSPKNGERILMDFGSDSYQANFTLIVNDLKSYVYVDDVYQGEYRLLDYRITESGSLAYAVLSGTFEGFGTRCRMTKLQAWIVDQ